MCYSAQITAAYQKLVRMTSAILSLLDFAVLYAHDPSKKRLKTLRPPSRIRWVLSDGRFHQ